MLPDIICIGIILFLVCAMLVSDKDSRKWLPADRYGVLYGIRREHNETCAELRTRIYAHRILLLSSPTGFETAMDRANEALIQFGLALRRAGAIDLNRIKDKVKRK